MLTPGSLPGSYEIVVALGAGGMGEVRARDTKLGRDIAIKILASAFVHDLDSCRSLPPRGAAPRRAQSHSHQLKAKAPVK